MLEFDSKEGLMDDETMEAAQQKEAAEAANREELAAQIEELRALNEQIQAENGYLKEFIRQHIINGEELLQSIETAKIEYLDVYDTMAYTEQKKTDIPEEIRTAYASAARKEATYGIRP